MANCISCGRQLPAISFGRQGEVCADCRASAVDVESDPRWAHRSGAAPPPPTTGRRSRPPITTTIVGVNVAVFVAMLFSGVSLTQPTTHQLLTWGANWGPLSLNAQPWRILASNYLHIGIIHIALNMWCLWNLGFLAEQIFEPWTYVLTYTACGIAGSIASLWWHPLVIGAGASGAIFGLAGALIAALYLGKLPIPQQAMRATMRSLLTFAGYNLFFGAVGAGIDNSAHIGGLITGLLLGSVLARNLTSPPETRNRWRSMVFIAATLALFGAYSSVKQAKGRVLPPDSIPSLYLPLLPRLAPR
jgi:rhomboid protease GluP